MWDHLLAMFNAFLVSKTFGGLLVLVAFGLVARESAAHRRVRRQCIRELETPKLLDRKLTLVHGATRPVPEALHVPRRLYLHRSSMHDGPAV